MRKRIAIFGLTEETLQLIPLLEANPDVEVAGICEPDAERLRDRLAGLSPEVAEDLRARVTASASDLARDASLHAIIDGGAEPDFATLCPDAADGGVQIVTPLAARLLWGYGAPSGDRKAELLQTLHEVVESYNLTINADELFSRMLEIARGVTGADGGSLMLLDPETRELTVRVAAGVEPELWPKIRLRLGEGIAGRVAAEARPLWVRGRADRQAFRIVHERLDVESALSVPLVHDGQVLGVLNLHHGSRPDAFTREDLEFAEQLARLDAQIIARAQEHAALRDQAARYDAVRRVQAILSERTPLPERLGRLCHFAAERAGHGIAHVYLMDPDDESLHLAATSLDGGGFGGEYRAGLGEGIDGTVAQSREPAFLRRADGSHAYAALPLLAGDALLGVLAIQSGSGASRGRAAEEILLEVAAAAAEGLAHAQREASMAARTTQVSAINEAGIRMISTRDPAEVMRLGTSGAAMALEGDHAILRLQDEQTGRYAIRSYFGSADGRQQEKLFRLDKRVSVAAIKRRAPLLVRQLQEDPALRDADAGVQSVLAAPLKREGQVIGTLALYDKMAPDRFTTGPFGEGDLELFVKYVAYLEKATANALFYSRAQQLRNFDEETGLPNAGYLQKRICEELARNDGREAALAVAICQIENLDEIERSADVSKARRVVQRTVDSLRQHVRNFDVVGRSGPAEFTVLLPEPGLAAGERVFDLARAVADDVGRDDALNEPHRVALAFGYAVYPVEGSDREALLERAREPRIRMV